MRTFLGIDLNSESLKKVNNLMLNLSKNGFRGNFTRKENIHLTLLFLGELDDDKINLVKNKMNEIDFSDFVIKINKVKKMKDMLILEVDKTDELMLLQKKIENKIKSLNIKVESREYYPHITLIREVNQGLNKELNINSNVNNFYLFSSSRINGSITYTKIYERR